jgi:hypothetical protein
MQRRWARAPCMACFAGGARRLDPVVAPEGTYRWIELEVLGRHPPGHSQRARGDWSTSGLWSLRALSYGGYAGPLSEGDVHTPRFDFMLPSSPTATATSGELTEQTTCLKQSRRFFRGNAHTIFEWAKLCHLPPGAGPPLPSISDSKPREGRDGADASVDEGEPAPNH